MDDRATDFRCKRLLPKFASATERYFQLADFFMVVSGRDQYAVFLYRRRRNIVDVTSRSRVLQQVLRFSSTPFHNRPAHTE